MGYLVHFLQLRIHLVLAQNKFCLPLSLPVGPMEIYFWVWGIMVLDGSVSSCPSQYALKLNRKWFFQYKLVLTTTVCGESSADIPFVTGNELRHNTKTYKTLVIISLWGYLKYRMLTTYLVLYFTLWVVSLIYATFSGGINNNIIHELVDGIVKLNFHKDSFYDNDSARVYVHKSNNMILCMGRHILNNHKLDNTSHSNHRLYIVNKHHLCHKSHKFV